MIPRCTIRVTCQFRIAEFSREEPAGVDGDQQAAERKEPIAGDEVESVEEVHAKSWRPGREEEAFGHAECDQGADSDDHDSDRDGRSRS